MTGRWSAQQAALGLAAGAVGLLLVLVLVVTQAGEANAAAAFTAIAVLAALPSLAYIAVYTEPIWLLSIGIVLASMSGNWKHLGLPGSIAPDRLVLGAALLAVGIRALRSAERVTFRPRAVHVVLGLAIAYAVASAIAAGTIGERAAIFRLVDRFGIVPFACFLVGPLLFRGARQREVLLRVVVAFGGYLGLTALFETVGPKALVFPKYILNPTIGSHADRARGPFIEAVSNGFALYACLVAAVIALVTWKGRWARAGAGAVAGLCSLGLVLSLTRSVWLGAVAASVIVLVAARETRRFAVPAVVAGALFVGSALALIPGLSARASSRADNQQTVWDRKNLNRAALNMIQAKPLFGFGWERFEADNPEHFRQADNYPLTRTNNVELHNVFLSNTTELGLVGTSLWALALLLGVGGAIAMRGPPELRPWRVGLAAIAICWVVIDNFVYPGAFAPLLLWVWAGVVWAGGSGRHHDDRHRHRQPPARPAGPAAWRERAVS
jgi:putative inorganic carbon (hco3(-)) transporter